MSHTSEKHQASDFNSLQKNRNPHSSDYRLAIRNYLDSVTLPLTQNAKTYGHMYHSLWEALRKTLAGGKLFRGWLVAALSFDLGNKDLDPAIEVGSAFELLHEGFLIHDDLIDGDTFRRGMPNLSADMTKIATTFTSDHSANALGHASGVLAGDLAIALAHRVLGEADVTAAAKNELCQLFFETIFVTVAGELNDVLTGFNVSRSSHRAALNVAADKTAKYSFQAPMAAASILANSSSDTRSSLDSIGLYLGRSFQLADDLLGLFAPEEHLGKSTTSDLREGKGTLVILCAKDLPVWSDISPYFGIEHINDDGAEFVRKKLAQSAAPYTVLSLAKEELREARALSTLLRMTEPEHSLTVIANMIERRLDSAHKYITMRR